MNQRGHVGSVLRRRLMFTAVIAGVALTLTGFSTGRGHGHHSGDGGGGGCSSSHSNSSGSSYRDYDDDDYGDDSYDDDYGSDDSSVDDSATESAPTPSDSPDSSVTVTLVSCVASAKPYATVDVDNGTAATGTFKVAVEFLDAAGATISTGTDEVTLRAYESRHVQVRFKGPGPLSKVSTCWPEPEAEPAA